MYKIIEGGVCAAKGFLASGIHVGIRKNPIKKDLALIYSEVPCVAVGVYTQNKVKAAPLLVTHQHLSSEQSAHAIVCNSGNANACTADGEQTAREMCRLVAEKLGIPTSKVLVASTGVIGQSLNLAPIAGGIESLVASLSSTGSDDASAAIMTTDLTNKELALRFFLGGVECCMGGIAKGSGMIHPNMATMLGFITTDVAIDTALLQKALRTAVADTFNMISVDGDTSTNDMTLVLANGEANNERISTEGAEYQIFYGALLAVCQHLAIAIAADGEGASKLLTCEVFGASAEESARALAKSVITSSLFKAAMFGEDANWGRVLCALGNSGAEFSPENVSITFSSTAGDVLVCQHGQGVDFSEELAKKLLGASEIVIGVTVGSGSHHATAWGCDLTYDYVKINGDYRS